MYLILSCGRNVYSAYEESVLEYSYLINVHQANNALPSFLGHTTGTFDHKGELTSGPASASLKYPNLIMDLQESRLRKNKFRDRIKDSVQYSASFDITSGQQDYDPQDIIIWTTGTPYEGKIDSEGILIKKVYYKTPYAMWRFYGYYGGLNVVGNFHNYGQFSDDSTFELIPSWQNKSQALAFEDAIYTRTCLIGLSRIEEQ